jgi:hypothetical protein
MAQQNVAKENPNLQINYRWNYPTSDRKETGWNWRLE